MMDQVPAAGGTMQCADLVELSVVLVATSNNPSIINPDFLAQNGIVGSNRKLKERAVGTPLYSQVVYEGGVTVRADPERVVFVESASESPLTNCLCPKMAESYARAVPHVPYRAVGINPKLYVRLSAASSAEVANVLDDQGSWLSFKDCEPEIQLKVIYPFSSRKIFMDVLSATGDLPGSQQAHGLLFQANVHRDLEQTSSTRTKALMDIFEEWESDVLDCRKLADKFTLHAFRDLT